MSPYVENYPASVSAGGAQMQPVNHDCDIRSEAGDTPLGYTASELQSLWGAAENVAVSGSKRALQGAPPPCLGPVAALGSLS